MQGQKQKRSQVPGKTPVNLEYDNNKPKILTTERTDITPLVDMDWIKKVRLTIGTIGREQPIRTRECI